MHFKRVDFMMYELFFNKAIIFFFFKKRRDIVEEVGENPNWEPRGSGRGLKRGTPHC